MIEADDIAWQDHAACYGKPYRLFFHDGQITSEAQALCDSCPVRIDCLEYAITHGEEFGVWGGRTMKEIRQIRRQRRMRRRNVDAIQRSNEVAVRTAAGESVRSIAANMHLDRRSVYRIRQEMTDE